MLVASDELTDKDWTALSRAKGDGFMIAGATLYGFSMFLILFFLLKTQRLRFVANATEELFVRKRPLYEVRD